MLTYVWALMQFGALLASAGLFFTIDEFKIRPASAIFLGKTMESL